MNMVTMVTTLKKPQRMSVLSSPTQGLAHYATASPMQPPISYKSTPKKIGNTTSHKLLQQHHPDSKLLQQYATIGARAKPFFQRHALGGRGLCVLTLQKRAAHGGVSVSLHKGELHGSGRRKVF